MDKELREKIDKLTEVLEDIVLLESINATFLVGQVWGEKIEAFSTPELPLAISGALVTFVGKYGEKYSVLAEVARILRKKEQEGES